MKSKFRRELLRYMSSVSKPLKYIISFIKKMSDKKDQEITYCLKCIKRTRNKDIPKALTLVNLIPQQTSKCNDCNARKSVFEKEYKPNKKQKCFFTNYKNMQIYCSVFKKHL